jgi:hypothetical protein
MAVETIALPCEHLAALLQNASDATGVSDFSNRCLMTRVYSGSSVMSLKRPSLLWPPVATALGDIISVPIAIVTT